LILARIEIDLVVPDEWPEGDAYDERLKQERLAAFLFRDHLRIALQQIRMELPDGFEIEADSLR